MCGICNVVRCIFGGGRSRRYNNCNNEFGRYLPRNEPRMNVHCASGLGSETSCPCREDYDWNCGCRRRRDYDPDCN